MGAKPYIGVTGPAYLAEVWNTVSAFQESDYNMNSQHIPMIGFLASFKTLNGELTENRRYPRFDQIRSLIEQVDHRAIAMIHYNSRVQDSLEEQVGRIFKNLYPDNYLLRYFYLFLI